MASGERRGEAGPPRERAANVVVPFPRRRSRVDLAAVVPSGRSLFLAFALLLFGFGCWWLARESSLFAVRRVEVVGAPARVSRQVERAVAREVGGSLVRLDATGVHSRVLELPTVRAASIDRAFPNTLRIAVVPERAVALIRQGSAAWLVSGRGRVIESAGRRRPLPSLPRIWVARQTRIEPGALVTGDARAAAGAAAALHAVGLARRVLTARAGEGELTLVLRSGLELRLGPPADIRLKLRVAARILPLMTGEAYVDVSLPERPVAGTSLNSQVEVETKPSTIA